MNRAKDPLTAATTSILKPALAPLGFRGVGKRTLARISDSVLQYVSLQLSAFGGRDFAVNYASITLLSPREFWVLEPGGRLPSREGLCDGWWPASNHARADASMDHVLRRLEAHALPWFARTATTAGLLTALHEMTESVDRPNGHWLLDIACCDAHLDHPDDARRHATLAIAAYQAAYDEMPARTWALDGVTRAEAMCAALNRNATRPLLADWRAASVRNLKVAALDTT